MERKCSAYTTLEGVATEVVPEKSLTTRHTGFYQEYLPETASSGQAAYHSIVQPYICRDTRVPRSHLGAVSLLVSAPAQLRITATMFRMEGDGEKREVSTWGERRERWYSLIYLRNESCSRSA
jgi:hypothetical protein